MSTAWRWVLAVVVTSLVAVACTNPDRPSVQADSVVLPTPLRSFGPQLAATMGLLEQALAGVGERIERGRSR